MSEAVHEAIVESISGLDGAGDDGSVEANAPAVPTAAESSSPQPSTAPAVPGSLAPAPPDATKTTVVPPDLGADGEPKLPGRLPLARHEKIVSGLREEHTKTIETLKQEHQRAVEEATAPYKQQRELLDIADRDPERFLHALAQADPRYRERLAPILQASHTNGGNGQAPQPVPTDMPEPDMDGGYSTAGLRRLLEWNAAQAEERVRKTYEPILQEYQGRQATTAALHRVNSQLEKAMKLPGFNEHQKEIAAAMRNDKSMQLMDGYLAVVVPKLQANRDTMRGELLAEINGKPKIITGTPPAGAARPAVESGDLQSVIKAAIANLPR